MSPQANFLSENNSDAVLFFVKGGKINFTGSVVGMSVVDWCALSCTCCHCTMCCTTKSELVRRMTSDVHPDDWCAQLRAVTHIENGTEANFR